ncbi:MAG: heme-dependent peroxidase [Pirellulales bacterium]|nr:heme-dependent peroxidase [Pirellulales bacterium]
MSHASPPPQEVSLRPDQGWHCSHLFYRWNRAALCDLSSADRDNGVAEVARILDPQAAGAPERLQTSVVAGHKADFALMVLDPDPLVIDGVHQRLLASDLGPAIEPVWSFVSLTEVSEYVPSVEQYGQRLIEEGESADSPAYQAKLKAYEGREVMMRRQRLQPEFPPWPSTCFYPMNKIRHPQANWFTLDVAERNRLMAEHGRTGMTFGGRVTQLITVSVGLDDWEWGVTLWARNPEFLKEIVYRMRFDEASAKYAQFGPFYTSYVMTPARMLEHCRVASR